MEYRMISVQILDSNGNQFTPDKVETYNESGTLISLSTSPIIQSDNSYLIIDDGNKNNIGLNKNHTVTFKIYKNSLIVKEEQFLLRADCCHVNKVSGPSSINVGM